MMSFSGCQFARLSAVSKVLFDKELIELRREYEVLKLSHQSLELKLFWEEHSVENLHAALKRNGIRGRFLVHVGGGLVECTLFPWFPTLAKGCGLDIAENDSEPLKVNYKSEVDSHCIVRRGRGVIAYGAKIWNAKTISDPELQKLKVLFEILNA
jgi:hypothetical protein